MVEVSRNVVGILLVLVVVVSGFGTYSLIAHERADDARGFTSTPPAASVGLQVAPRMTDGSFQMTIQNPATETNTR